MRIKAAGRAEVDRGHGRRRAGAPRGRCAPLVAAALFAVLAALCGASGPGWATNVSAQTDPGPRTDLAASGDPAASAAVRDDPDGEAVAARPDAAGDAGEAVADEPAAPPQESADEKKARETAELCHLLMGAAERYGVPPEFFIRLIWKESRFNAGAVSPVGAQGIAQFMPGTARLRGLKNPFDREEALNASASFLADMEARFGSWGLAAIGYNGGPNRVMPLVRGTGGLPYETIDYVFSITGRSHQYWAQRAREALGITREERLAGDTPLPTRRPGDAPPTDANGEAAAAPASEADTADTADKADEADRAEVADTRDAAEADAPEGEAIPITLAALSAARADAVDEGRIPSALRIPAPRPDYTPTIECPTLVARLGRERDVAPPGGATGFTRWGAQVAGHTRRAVAMRQYARIKGKLPADLRSRGPVVVVRRFAARGRLPIHAVMFPAGSHGEAKAMCRRVAKALAPCVVVKNG